MVEKSLLVINDTPTNIEIHTAQNIKEWFVGLSKETSPLVHTGLLLKNCKSIQMKTCSIAIDVVFVTRKGVVTNVFSDVQPNSNNRRSLKGWHCYELPVGTIDLYNISINDTLSHSI